MTRFSKFLQVALVALTLSAPTLAADSLKPEIPPAAKGTECQEPADVMRRKHMDYLMAHRDETMRQGIRTTKYSLKACIECHAAPAEEQPVAKQGGAKEEGGHFCMNCHAYAGVKIDCFQCHATRPEKAATFHPLVTPGMAEVKGAHEGSASMLNQISGATEKTGGAQ